MQASISEVSRRESLDKYSALNRWFKTRPVCAVRARSWADGGRGPLAGRGSNMTPCCKQFTPGSLNSQRVAVHQDY
jgi:hypothetical protein